VTQLGLISTRVFREKAQRKETKEVPAINLNSFYIYIVLFIRSSVYKNISNLRGYSSPLSL
jgi:hypothetical protein